MLKRIKVEDAIGTHLAHFGVPGCGLHHRITVLDLVLPRILAGENIGKKELAFFGHGCLCKDCPECSNPHCPFGKGI